MTEALIVACWISGLLILGGLFLKLTPLRHPEWSLYAGLAVLGVVVVVWPFAEPLVVVR